MQQISNAFTSYMQILVSKPFFILFPRFIIQILNLVCRLIFIMIYYVLELRAEIVETVRLCATVAPLAAFFAAKSWMKTLFGQPIVTGKSKK